MGSTILATYKTYIFKLRETGNNILEILGILDRDSTYLQYIVMAKKVETQKQNVQPVKKRALFLSTEVIQKTKTHGQNQKQVAFQQLAQKASKISNPLIAISQTFQKLAMQSFPSIGRLGNKSVLSPSVDSESPTQSPSKQAAKPVEAGLLSQYEGFMKMRKDIGKHLTKLSNYKHQFQGRSRLPSS